MRIHELLIIPELFLPEENIVIWDNGFSEQDIQEIISTGELFEFSKGKVGTDQLPADPEIRDTDITWMEPCDNTAWLYKRFGELAAKINYDKFQFDLTHFQPFQYGKYKINSHYDWHIDSGPNLPEHRKLTFVLALSDPDDYEGGELEINITGNQDKCQSIKIKKGHLVVFPSSFPHRVKPVTSGERLTLVGWAIGPKLR